MHWRFSTSKSSGLDYIGDAEASPVPEAVQELWRKYVEDASPKNAEIAWDHLRVELWLDSGRIILYPAIAPFRQRIERSACQMACPDLVNFYDRLIESNLPDDKLEEQLTGKENELVELLSTSARKMKLPELLCRQSVRVLCYGADLEKAIKEDNLDAL